MKKVSFLFMILISSLIFAGCRQTASNKDIKLTKSIDLDQNQAQQTSPSPLNTNQKQNINQKQKDNLMKTIQDFEPIEATQATLTTTKGDIVVTLFRNKAPLTTANFLNLAKDGFYDGIIFHRVIPDFMAQVGDPLTKDSNMEASWGTGGPGYQIADEFHPELVHDVAGVLSMANSGPNTGGSQFFITFEATPWLDGKHAVFGKITAGLEVLNQIKQGDKILSVSFE